MLLYPLGTRFILVNSLNQRIFWRTETQTLAISSSCIGVNASASLYHPVGANCGPNHRCAALTRNCFDHPIVLPGAHGCNEFQGVSQINSNSLRSPARSSTFQKVSGAFQNGINNTLKASEFSEACTKLSRRFSSRNYERKITPNNLTVTYRVLADCFGLNRGPCLDT